MAVKMDAKTLIEEKEIEEKHGKSRSGPEAI